MVTLLHPVKDWLISRILRIIPPSRFSEFPDFLLQAQLPLKIQFYVAIFGCSDSIDIIIRIKSLCCLQYLLILQSGEDRSTNLFHFNAASITFYWNYLSIIVQTKTDFLSMDQYGCFNFWNNDQGMLSNRFFELAF